MEKKVDSAKPDLAFKILVFLEKVPTYLKQGPWSPVAHLYLIVLCGYVLLSFDYAIALYGEVTDVNSVSFASNALAGSNDWIQNYRFYGAAYMLCILALVIYTSGVWPLASYTVTSWNLTTIRLIASFIGASNLSLSPQFQTVADMVRLPALIGCSVTVIVWWIVLVPVISAYMPDDEARKKFAAFNTTFPLLNLHLFNLPLCAIEFLACGKCLSFFDLWASLAVAFLYMMFYLNVLDPSGLHFYIVFTPRTHWCFIPYSMILFAYYGLYHSWSYALQTVGGLTC